MWIWGHQANIYQDKQVSNDSSLKRGKQHTLYQELYYQETDDNVSVSMYKFLQSGKPIQWVWSSYTNKLCMVEYQD